MEAAVRALREAFAERKEDKIFFGRAFQLSTVEEVAQQILNDPPRINNYFNWKNTAGLLSDCRVRVSSMDFADYCDKNYRSHSSEGVDTIHQLLLSIAAPVKIDLERFM